MQLPDSNKSGGRIEHSKQIKMNSSVETVNGQMKWVSLYDIVSLDIAGKLLLTCADSHLEIVISGNGPTSWLCSQEEEK